MVRSDGARFVLVEGLHRPEAAKALGEKTIVGFRVAARKQFDLLRIFTVCCRYCHSRIAAVFFRPLLA
jgi:hypothetical protein